MEKAEEKYLKFYHLALSAGMWANEAISDNDGKFNVERWKYWDRRASRLRAIARRYKNRITKP